MERKTGENFGEERHLGMEGWREGGKDGGREEVERKEKRAIKGDIKD